MEVVNHDVVELILERVPVKSLVRFKSVSKQWKSTMEFKNFQDRQLIHRQQSRHPDVLFVTFPIDDSNDDDDTEDIPSSLSLSFSVDDNDDDDNNHIRIISSWPYKTVKFPIKKTFGNSASCDGLICFYNDYESIVVNPTTQWHRTLPPSNLQQQRITIWHQTLHSSNLQQRLSSYSVRKQFGFSSLGFGKDKFNGTYKSVWLYSSTREFRSDLAWSYVTTCEVFDFNINAWRYVTLASPYEIITYIEPVNIDGSLYWLTKRELGIDVLSFDLHTETFQVVAEAPFDKGERHHYKMCNLNNRLCISETKYPNQVIWLFNSGTKTWNHMHSIDLKKAYSWVRKSTRHDYNWYSSNCIGSVQPLAVLEEKNEKTKVLFSFYVNKEPSHLLIYDGKSYELAFSFNSFVRSVCYFESLISIL